MLESNPLSSKLPQHLDQCVGEGVEIDVELAHYQRILA